MLLLWLTRIHLLSLSLPPAEEKLMLVYLLCQAEGIAQAVAALLRRGVPPSELGVIAFYKAQVWYSRTGGV